MENAKDKKEGQTKNADTSAAREMRCSRRRMAARAVQLREKPVNTEEEGTPQTES